MIFGGPAAYCESRGRQKRTWREVNAANPAVLRYLKWSEAPITFDRADYLDHVPQPGRLPLVLDPIVSSVRLSKVFMDGESALNILSVDAFRAMKLTEADLRPTHAPFHGVVPEGYATPLG